MMGTRFFLKGKDNPVHKISFVPSPFLFSSNSEPPGEPLTPKSGDNLGTSPDAFLFPILWN